MLVLLHMLIGSAVAQSVDASFFVYPDGRYVLNIYKPGQWTSAELNTSIGSTLDMNDWPNDGLTLRGQLDLVPDHLWVSLKLANDQDGFDSSFSIPTVLVPGAMPELRGSSAASLPKMSLMWKTKMYVQNIFSGRSKKKKNNIRHNSDKALGKRIN